MKYMLVYLDNNSNKIINKIEVLFKKLDVEENVVNIINYVLYFTNGA